MRTVWTGNKKLDETLTQSICEVCDIEDDAARFRKALSYIAYWTTSLHKSLTFDVQILYSKEMAEAALSPHIFIAKSIKSEDK